MIRPIFIMLLTLVSFHFTYAQIPVLNAPDTVILGTVVTTVFVDTAGISEGGTGANQTWDFSNLTPTGFTISNTSVDPDTANGGSNFPNADAATEQNSGGFITYSAISSSSIEVLGIFLPAPQVGPTSDAVVKYDDPETVMEFPFTYNSAFTDSFIDSNYVTVNNDNASRYGNVSVTATSHGQIMLPFGTFDALKVTRIREDNEETSTKTITTINTVYEWYIEGTSSPVFRIVTEEFYDNSVLQFSNRSVGYIEPDIDTSTGVIEMAPQLAQVSLFPNPAQNGISRLGYTLVRQAETVNIAIYDAAGKQITQLYSGSQVAGQHPIDIATHHYSKGYYIIRLEVDGIATNVKLLVQ